MNKRTDYVTALLVDAAINVSVVHGWGVAARSLAEAGIPLHVTLRVLTRPRERRRDSFAERAPVPT
jgi:hypothetical protein